jgi:hypothetical protein
LEARSIREFSLFIRPKLTLKFNLIANFADVCDYFLRNSATAKNSLPVSTKFAALYQPARVQGKAQMWYLERPFFAGWRRFYRNVAALFDFLSAGANTPWL